jgi:hypothetical protein
VMSVVWHIFINTSEASAASIYRVSVIYTSLIASSYLQARSFPGLQYLFYVSPIGSLLAPVSVPRFLRHQQFLTSRAAYFLLWKWRQQVLGYLRKYVPHYTSSLRRKWW